MKIKFLLPVLAFIFAIGMSFTTLESERYAATGWIDGPNGWEQITVDCPGPTGANDCRVYFSSNPSEVYPVHDALNGNIIKTTNEDPVEL